MRRRRQVLQVSTFPFLAVLLCAMGSLILLLLVIDRRAKVVARAKALELVRQVAAEDEKTAAARQAESERQRAEWERRRQALHEELNQENRQALEKIGSVKEQIETATGEVQVEQRLERELQERIQTEKSRLSRQEEEMTARARATAQSRTQSEAGRRELARLTAELKTLEQTLEDLKALRQRQQQTYSLVPYRGRRGDNRRPLYLECAANGLIFHPDHTTISVGETSGRQVQAEVERRLAARAESASGKEEAPYLLFLIRPNGILTYYQTLNALNGLKLDFGYEFVEPDWVLNFPVEDKGGPQPWMVAEEKPIGSEVTQRSPDRNGQAVRTVHGIPPRMQSAGDEVMSGAGARSVLGPSRSGQGSVTSRPGSAPVVIGRPSDEFRPPGGTGSEGTPSFSRGSGGNPAGQPGLDAAKGGRPAIASSPPNNATGSFVRGGERGLSTVPVPVFPNNLVGGAGNARSPQSKDGLPNFGSQGREAKSPAGISSADRPGLAGLEGSELEPVTSMPASPPQHSSQAGGFAKGESGGGTGLQSPPGQSVQNSGSVPGGTGRSNSGSPSLLDSESDSSKKKPTSLPPVRRWVSRDWSIFIECRSDGVVVYPGGVQIPAANLSPSGIIGPRPLSEAVQQLLARRQTSIGQAAEDEAMMRPHIRFLVRPDGLRSYYQAYPELGGFQLPMTRENLDPDEDIAPHLIAR